MQVKFRSESGVDMEKDEYVPLTVADARSLSANAIYNSDSGIRKAVQIVDDMIRKNVGHYSDYLYKIDFDKPVFDEVRKLTKRMDWIGDLCSYYRYRGFNIEGEEWDKNYNCKTFTLKWEIQK